MYVRSKGFTLVELLAVLVILAVILVIAVPKVMDIIKVTRISTLESTAKLVALSAEKKKVENEIIGNTEILTCENVVKINDIDYESCYIEFINNKAVVTIIGSGTFKGMNACEATKNNANITERCLNKKVEVTLELNGGSASDITGVYKEGTVIDLEEPIKENSTFTSYEIVSGNSVITNNKLTVGSTNTIIHAVYESWPSLEIDLDGGNDNTDYKEKYKSGSIIELEVPTKTGYTFTGWIKESGNSVLSGNNLTMGSKNTKVKAIWQENKYTIRYELGGGTFDNIPPVEALYNSIIEINNPKKEAYKFIGWTISGFSDDVAKSGNSITDISTNIVSSETKITDEYFINLNKNMNSEIIMVANWEFIPSVTVYKYSGDYLFNGANYIDTGVYLFNEENASKDFEVSFTIKEAYENKESYTTLFNSMSEDGNAFFPGVTFRINSYLTYYEAVSDGELNGKLDHSYIEYDLKKTKKVQIFRINNVLYVSINDEEMIKLRDYTGFNRYFQIPATFGASTNLDGSIFRYFNGVLSNMEIKFINKP